jgi:hypothetical protein
MTEALRARDRGRFVVAMAYAATLWAVCSIPGHAIPLSSLMSWDKLWHLLGFAILYVLWRRAGYAGVPVAVAAVAYGVAIEAWQQIAPIGRFFDPLDILADAAGVAVGIVLFRTAGQSKRADAPATGPAG